MADFKHTGKGRGLVGHSKSAFSKFSSNFKGLPGNFSKDVSGMMSDLGGNVFGGLLNKFKGFSGGSVFKQFSNSGVNVSNMASLLSKNARELDLDFHGGAETVMKNDPFAFTSVTYPQDLTVDKSIGSWIQFYINVQNVTKYNFRTPTGGYVHGKNIKSDLQYNPIYTTTGDSASAEGLTVTETPHWDNVTTVTDSDAQAPYNLQNSFIESDVSGLDYLNDSSANQKLAQLYMNKRKRKYGLMSISQPTTRIAHSCSIYLPNQQDNLSMSYNTHETGLVGYGLATAWKMGKAWSDKDWKQVAEVVLGGLGAAGVETMKNLGLGIAETLTSSEGGYELMQKVYGAAQNPYMEVLFHAPELRQFTYQFTFAPRNAEETEDVQNIIKLMRFHMAPELRQDHNMFVTLPSEFDIYYMYKGTDGTVKENPYVNKISTCALTSCNVDYTPTGVKTHPDGSPVMIKMALTFKEMDMITKEHIAEGF